jgi:Putative adhesin
MLRRAFCLVGVFVLFLTVISALPCFAITKEFNESYPLQPGGSFELQNVNGAVELQGWDGDTVEIHAVKTAKNKESDLDLVTIEVDAKSSAVSVSTHYPQNEGVEVAVEYTVRVPNKARVEHVGTVNGTLRVSGIEAVEELHTVNGNIEVYDGGGSVHARSTNGNVHLELLHVADRNGAVAETTNGSVLVAIPADTQANLEARCLNGNFSSELPVAFETTLRPREMHGKLGHGGAPLRLHTVNGGIRIVALRSTV